MLYLLIALGLLLLLFLFMLLRTFMLPEPEFHKATVEKVTVSKDLVAKHLSEAISIKTVSKAEMKSSDFLPFREYHTWLEKTYPTVHSSLKKEVISDFSLLYLWEGTDKSLKPVLFGSHLDVVPVDEATLSEWSVKPFAGEIKNGYVWGRGTLDMKNHTIGLFNAVEGLLKSGYQPKRDIYFGFGHDEEISGKDGAKQIAAALQKRGVQLAAVLDEGGMVAQGLLSGIESPIGLIGIGEKEYVTVNMTTKGTPGHSSNPPRQTAIGIMARAIALLDDHRLPARPEIAIETLKRIANLFPFTVRFVLANTWLLKSILVKQLEKQTQTNALIRTTHAATVIHGGIKDNILPAETKAKINFRLLPGDSQESILKHIEETIKDPRVEVEIDLANAWGPSEVSTINTPAYKTLELVIRQIFGDIPVTPYLLMFATDARHYQEISEQIYHFSPVTLDSGDTSRMHGIDERISIDDLARMVQFYERILKVWGEAQF